MKLDENQRKTVLEVLRKKAPKAPTCSACHRQKWTVGDRVFQMPEYGVAMAIGGPVVPVIPLTCINCGNTLFFNAMALGVVQPRRVEARDE